MCSCCIHFAFSAHFHDTYGQALVNLLAVLQEGVAVIDSAVAGQLCLLFYVQI